MPPGADTSYLQREGGIVWVFPPSKPTEEQLDRVLADLSVELRRGSPYVLLFDLTRAEMPNAMQRQKLTAHIRDNAPRIKRWIRGVGVVLASPVVRGVVTAIFWVAPPEAPYRFFATRVEAADWASSLLEKVPGI